MLIGICKHHSEVHLCTLGGADIGNRLPPHVRPVVFFVVSRGGGVQIAVTFTTSTTAEASSSKNRCASSFPEGKGGHQLRQQRERVVV